MNEHIQSPLTDNFNTVQVGSVTSAEIISIYRDEYGFEISDYFAGIDEIKIMRCCDSQFMFYYPFTTEGDEWYYAKMSQFEWYYHPSRWEHGKALELIGSGEKVLEVGAGAGFFIERLLDKNIEARGLELNGRAIEVANERGIELIKELVQSHAESHTSEYDVVCSFQVLEHIAEPASFLASMVNCLRPGGKLIIGVPNNDSYLFKNRMPSKVLNMPPHHMGLWTPESLSALQGLLDIRLRDVYYEPLVDGNVAVYMWNKLNDLFLNVRFFTRVIWKLKIDRAITPLLMKYSDRIRGSSVLAVFTRD